MDIIIIESESKPIIISEANVKVLICIFPTLTDYPIRSTFLQTPYPKFNSKALVLQVNFVATVDISVAIESQSRHRLFFRELWALNHSRLNPSFQGNSIGIRIKPFELNFVVGANIIILMKQKRLRSPRRSPTCSFSVPRFSCVSIDN